MNLRISVKKRLQICLAEYINACFATCPDRGASGHSVYQREFAKTLTRPEDGENLLLLVDGCLLYTDLSGGDDEHPITGIPFLDDHFFILERLKGGQFEKAVHVIAAETVE